MDYNYGKFQISECLFKKPDSIALILGGMVVERVEFKPWSGVWEYLARSVAFDPVSEGCVVPYYEAVICERDVTWKKVGEPTRDVLRSPIEFIQHMSVLNLKPNDIIVLKSPHRLKAEVLHNMRKFFFELGLSNKIVILEDGIDIGVTRQL